MAYHVAAATRILTGESPLARRVLAGMGLSPASGAPLLAGLFLGIAFGGGFDPSRPGGKAFAGGSLPAVPVPLHLPRHSGRHPFFVLLTAHEGPLVALRLFIILVAIRLSLAILMVRSAGRFVAQRLEPESAA